MLLLWRIETSSITPNVPLLLRCGRLAGTRADLDLAVYGIDFDHAALLDIPGDEGAADLRFQRSLYQPLQGAGSVYWVVTCFRKVADRRIRQLQLDVPLPQPGP